MNTQEPRLPQANVASRWLSALLMFVLLAVSGTAAYAQLAGKGAITGTVTDSEGAAIPGAKVVATKIDTGVAVTTTTTSAGDYNIPTLNPGQYTVVVTAPGFQQLKQEHVQINALETQTFSPKLAVGATTETVTVSSIPPQLETSNATLGATMENDVYSALPLEMGAYGQPDQRRATDFVFLMPGVQGNNTNGNPTTNAGIVNGSGARGAVSGIYIDGVVFVRGGGNGDPRYVWTAISVDAVDQFQVQTNGYSAVYEGQGIQNYVVKQGGNQYHGSVYEFFRNTALDTWGFFGANVTNPFTGKAQKPVEHSNEYGIDLGGPLVPFGSWKDKVFFFGNYSGFRYSSQTPTAVTFPTLAEQHGDFSGITYSSGGTQKLVPIYDPFTQAACTAANNGVPCRYAYSGNIIPSSEFSAIAQKLQSAIPALTNQAEQNNYFSANSTGLTNWSTTERIDVNLHKHVLTFLAAIGRQASSFPVGQTTSGRNVGPIPYNYGQAYAPKTAVGIVEDAWTISPHLVNQLKYGFARYNGPTYNADYNTGFGAASFGGLTNLPAGQASDAFPITSFSGDAPPTQWAGTTASSTIAQNFTLVDNLQWEFGKHSLTIGGQIAWLEYLNQPAFSGNGPLTLSNSATETAQLNGTKPGQYSTASHTGLAYASFLVGEIDKASLTQYAVQEYASRFRAISPYIQDNWKVSKNLTLDLGLRWDYFPPVREAHDQMSFFSPTATNTVTGLPGGLQFAGNGTNTCNCDTPINNYWKNFGPRIGFAYQSDPKTVWRGSYGVMFTHGGAVGGGNASSLGGSSVSNGFSTSIAPSATGQDLGGLDLTGTNTAVPSLPVAQGRSTPSGYGTGYTNISGYTGSPLGISYLDPYLGSRAPEYINWSFGFQHQWTSTFTTTISYVGSQGHFLQPDSMNGRGYWSNQLDPKYLSLGSNLTLTGTSLRTYCAANAGVCPASLGIFSTSQSLAQLLKPFPFHSVSDTNGNIGNANYHALQISANMRPTHGLTVMANFTWSRSIDDAGTFRSGYAIPAAYSNTGRSWAPDAIERSLSTANQPYNTNISTVWAMPFGRSIANGWAWERAVLGGFQLSGIFQAFSGSPLAITGSSCNTNPAQSQCMPNYNPNFPLHGNAMQNGNWGDGVTRANYNTISFINSNAFQVAPAYTFGNLSRTAPYNLYGPGNYNLDLSLRRTFPLHFTDKAALDVRVDYRNVTNHTQFSVASTAYGNSSFGEVNGQKNDRRAAQLAARINF